MSNTFTSTKVRQIFSFVIHLVFHNLLSCVIYILTMNFDCFGFSIILRYCTKISQKDVEDEGNHWMNIQVGLDSELQTT